MNTPAHLIVAAAVFAKPDKPKVTWLALVAAFIPDFSLYTLAAWSMFVQGNPAQHVFDVQYFSTEWQSIFAVDNSFFVWGLIVIAGIALKKHWLWAFGGAGFLHILLDFPLHHDDARQHFWPLSDWVFQSPLSYWDHKHYGDIISLLELGLCVTLLTILWQRFSSRIVRGIIILTMVSQVMPVLLFSLML